ncbi:MAG: TIM-barrel domain-containing protein [candidate division WOR-3 bacterium]
MRRSVFFLLTFVFFRALAFDVKIHQLKNGFWVRTRKFNIKVQFYRDNIVRVVKWLPEGSEEKLSLVILWDTLPNVMVELKENDREILLSSERVKVKISKEEGKIEYLTAGGEIILREKGEPKFIPVKDKYEKAFSVEQKFILTPDEGIYGLGQHQDGYMNYRGRKVLLVQTNTDAVIPFFISTHRYGILWDNYSKTIFEDKEGETLLWSDVGDNIDYYFIYGKDMDEIISSYRSLTGQAPMYGKWAYGYWQSKEHYATREELLNIAQEYRRRKIPIDNIVQDWQYWGGNDKWSGMIFDEERYPNPEEMIKILHDLNFHIMFSIWPGLGPNTQIYKDMEKRGYLFNVIGWASFKYYDTFIPEANDLYWKYLKKGLFSKGVDAWWVDSSEPDIVNATTKESQEYEMKKIGRNYLGSWARYLNAYSLLMMDKLYENQRKETDKKRVYILTRSAFLGQQRAAATTWSGDIGASWEIYKKQIAAGINFCMSGIPYWTFDIGGFVLGAYGGVFSKGGKDPSYQELYARMFQFGAFCPIFRAHGSETPREIWEFGEFSESMIKIDNLRYRLLPYIYSLAWKVTSEGYTIMRGLPMDFTEDKRTYSISDQFMFGPSIMVCPVTEYMIYRPPDSSILITPEHFRTKDGKLGLQAKYYKDSEFKILSYEQIEPNINHRWYTGRPFYMTDSAFSVRWEGKLIPTETGKHQFHLKSYDAKRIFLNRKELPFIYTSVEQYTDFVELEAGKEYEFILEMQNRSTGAAKMKLYWKTPSIFKKEEIIEKREKKREVYLPKGCNWIDFWTGNKFRGGQEISSDAPTDRIPLFVKEGSIIPMGPFIQYSTEKPPDPIELRVYPGADAYFTLYEDENDNYNYEKGLYSTIPFCWNDERKELTIGDRQGCFPGMLKERTFRVILVKELHGIGIEITKNPDKTILYKGNKITVSFKNGGDNE